MGSPRQGHCLCRVLCQAIQTSGVLTEKIKSKFLCRLASLRPVLKILRFLIAEEACGVRSIYEAFVSVQSFVLTSTDFFQ